MRPIRRPSVERIAALAVIIAAHLLLLELVSRNGKRHVGVSEPERGELFFIDPLPPTDEPLPVPPPRAAKARASPSTERAPGRGNAITLPQAADAKPPA